MAACAFELRARHLVQLQMSCRTHPNPRTFPSPTNPTYAVPALHRRIAVVTSDFHMARTQATFDFVYSLAGRQLHGDPSWYSLDYRPGAVG